MNSHDWGRSALTVVDCIADDGSSNGQALLGVVSEWASEDTDAQSSMVWEVGDDEDYEDEVSLTVSQFASLLADAQSWRRHVASGVCPCVGKPVSDT